MGKVRSLLLRPSSRARFWMGAGLSVASVVLLVLTLFVPDWIEAVFRIDPDRRNGSLEWALDGVLLAIAVAAGVLARIEWRRQALHARAEPISSPPHSH